MMELNDNEFDATFREKVFNAEPQFEEAAWDKMEQKLKRRERVVFFRKATALSLLFLIIAVAYYSLFRVEPRSVKSSLAKEKIALPEVKSESKRSGLSVDLAEQAVKPSQQILVYGGYKIGNTFKKKELSNSIEHHRITVNTNDSSFPVFEKDSLFFENSRSTVVLIPEVMKQDSNVIASNGSDVQASSVTSIVSKKKDKQRNHWPVSLSLSIGPEFNSSSSVIGGKGGFSAGLGLSVGIAKKVKLQTGLKYSIKGYGTDGYGYAFRNEKAKWIVSHVDASCAVIEIPLLASITVMQGNSRSVDLNVGMSSYFMLKEDYTFKYTAESGYKDRLLEINNKNQHYFGVIDLSATYYKRFKQEKISVGLEPYLKIPLTGVGEGKVNLKSSGVALKLRYDLGKNNK